jgi:hypothetical protein
LVFSELILALFSYPLHYRDNHLVINVVNLATIGLGTLFRFWAYKRFVFLDPDRDTDPDLDTDPARSTDAECLVLTPDTETEAAADQLRNAS